MRKLLFLICFIPVILLCACNNKNKHEAAIFLSDSPINSNNFSNLQQNPTFQVSQRIYFVLVSKQPIESPVLRLQTIKLENKYGYPISQMEIPYAVDMERGPNQHVVTDYFVLHQDGPYFIRIFSVDNLNKPLAEAQFTVEKL